MATSSDTRPRPKIQRLPPLPPAPENYHRIRKRIHLLFFLIFLSLPFFDVMRFDIPHQRFYFAGVELWISEFAIILLSMMFLMFVVVAMALLYGRIYCGYACPQMIFSEWSWSLEARIKKEVTKRFSGLPPNARGAASKGLFYAIIAIASVFLAFFFTSYFVEPRDLLTRLLHLDIRTAGGITGAAVTLITFLDFAFIRQHFCTTICPYGYLQGMLQDKQTLLVIYRDGKDAQKNCIECGKCVRVCEMGIDIRKSPYQIECVHCGECVDACEDVLRRIGKPGLIHYDWGEKGGAGRAESWYLRWGFRDMKRAVIVFVLTAYLAGLAVALSLRQPVLVRVAPDRTVLYRTLEDGRIANLFRITVANRGKQAASMRYLVEGLPGVEFTLPEDAQRLEPGRTMQTTFELRTRPWPGSSDVNHFRFVAAVGGGKSQSFEMTFILPVEKGAAAHAPKP
ncbi:MAG: 4Fe-4S dicluster domain-containing protein [Bryobacteraceae bacterium]